MKRCLAGTNLYQNPRGVYVWRRVDPRTGKRRARSTQVERLDLALRKAAQFEDELQRELAGLRNYDCWRLELEPLAGAWLEALVGEVGESGLKTKRVRILRALDELRLKRAADLDDVAKVNDRLLALGRREGLTPDQLRRNYQDDLKQLSKWLAENNRHLDRDPLASWARLRARRSAPRRPKRRAFLPDEVARAFLASDRIDAHLDREHPLRPVFLALLVTAPREGALLSRDVEHLDRRGSRLRLGDGVGNKRRGTGALDPATLAELIEYVGGRGEGALFLSPTGFRIRTERLLDWWREAFSLGVLDVLWPLAEPWDFELVLLVNAALLRGEVRVSRGGNPKRLRPESRAARDALTRRVQQLATDLGAEWRERMAGVDVHAFRKTHRTWAMAKAVPEVLIDKQLGHAAGESPEALEVLRTIAGSETGRRHYLDIDSPLLDAGRSAAAVRGLLDEALLELHRAHHGGHKPSNLVAFKMAFPAATA